MIRLILIAVLISPASAAIVLSQGDPVYIGETVDISLAASWPDFQLAWCAANNYDCDPPDQVLDVTGNMHKFLIDDKFHIGTYYRWDGTWHSAENAVAFTVMPGKRPRNTTAINRTALPGSIIKRYDGPYHYIVARGDTPEVYTVLQNQSGACHLWLFTNTVNTYNLPLVASNESRYSYQFNESETYALDVGDYAGYIQCDGKNEWQDIYLEDLYLDTPYDDKKVPDVPIMEWNLLNTKRQFDELAKSIPRFDDDLIPVTISVVDPTVTITDVEQTEDKLYIMGSTTWGNNTPVTLRLDPDNYKLSRDIQLHTWQTFATGSIDAPRMFATALPFYKEELFVGMHEITSTVEKKGNTAVSAFNFRVSDVMVMPTPTPVAKRMIYGKDWENIPVKVEPTPTPVNETVEWEEWVEVTPEETPAVNVTANVTPAANLTTIPTVVPVASKTIPTIPIESSIIIAGVWIAFVLWRRE